MGIKLHCPNGHKLNVKSFLAGKKGVCPHCGASFRIPKEENAADDDAPEPVAAAPAAPASTAAAPGGSPVVSPVIASVAPATVAPVGVVPGMPAIPIGQAVAPVAVADPIAEAPLAAWYVRPPSGGQYGPARGEVMRKWIGEGRVSSDSLVWREGWTDWRGAGQLFPSLLAPADTGPATPPVPAVSLAPRASRAPVTAAPRQGNGLAIVSVVFLAIVCIALVVALVFVLGGVK